MLRFFAIDSQPSQFPFVSSTGRQHYRLYTICHIPSLKVLDFCRITTAERDKARRLAKSAAGAALESDVQQEAQQQDRTFTPGEGQSAAESFQTSFTPEQKEQLRTMVANAKSPQEIEQIESFVQRGIFPSHLLPKEEEQLQGKDDSDPANNGAETRKRSPEEVNGETMDVTTSKRART